MGVTADQATPSHRRCMKQHIFRSVLERIVSGCPGPALQRRRFRGLAHPDLSRGAL